MRRAHVAIAGLFAVLYATLATRQVHESDALWHAELGRTVLRQHARTVVEPMAIDLLARTCTAHEWLWDVVTFSLQRSFGWVSVELLTAACAALAAIAFVGMVRSWNRTRSLAAVAAAVACLSPAVLSRVRERPEIVALVLLPVVMQLSRAIAVDDSPGAANRSFARIALLALVALFWSQTHAAFVLAPVVTAVIAGPELLRRGRRGQAAALAVAYLLVLGASPYGTNLLAALAAHGSGFSGQHIAEWTPPTFALFDPADRPPFPLYALAWLVIAAGTILRRRLPRREIALALVGVLLVLRGRRGIGPAALLTGPALAWAFDQVLTALSARRRTWRRAGAALVLVPSLTWAAADSAREEGTPLRFGLSERLRAPDGLRFLASLPPGTRGLTTYLTGAIVGFGLDGQVRTFVDSRTPLIFGDADLAMAFAVWSNGEDLARATEHYDLRFAMVGRDDVTCAILAVADDWKLVAVDRRYSTFARVRDSDALQLSHLSPCGPSYLTDDACRDGRLALDRDLASVPDRPFAAYLAAERAVACAGPRDPLDADAIVRALPSAEDSEGFLAARTGLYAWVLASAGHPRAAADLVLALSTTEAEARDTAITRVAPVTALRSDAESAAATRDLLQPLVDAPANDAPAWAWGALANACATLGDLRCTETNALRAAASGIDVRPALCFVARNARDPALRDDARAWLDSARRDARDVRDIPCPPL